MTSVVSVHAVGGTLLLVLGVTAAVAPKRRRRSPHVTAGTVYVGILVVTLVTGMVVGLRNPGVTLFEVATPPTLVMGLAGWAAARYRPRDWLAKHIAGVGGSLIGVVTAAGFQVVPRVVELDVAVATALWVVPTTVGSLLIRRAVVRRTRTNGKHPRHPVAAPAAAWAANPDERPTGGPW